MKKNQITRTEALSKMGKYAALTAIGTFTNPTTCSGNDGTITLTGLTANENYIVTVDGTSVSFTADFAGMLTITGLTSGTYNSISISANGCDSNVVGPVTLTDPSALPIALNAPTCNGEEGSIEITGLATFTNYTVNYNYNGTPQQVVLATNGLGIITLNNLLDGNYDNFVVTDENGCSSSAAGTVTVDCDCPTFNLALGTFTNPTTCEGNDGTITLSGLDATTTYDVTYTTTGICPQSSIQIVTIYATPSTGPIWHN